jgi:hypothetical protein
LADDEPRTHPRIPDESSGDGEPQEIKPGRSFARTADTIAALGVDLLEVLDAQGNVIRAMRLDSPEASRVEAAATPHGLEADPNALMLTHFANLLHRAYSHSTEIAFTKMVELVERIGDRSDAIEQRLERTEIAHRKVLHQQIEDAFDRAEEAAEKAQETAENQQGDLLSNRGNAFLGGMSNQAKPGVRRATTNGAPNGKGHD